MSAHSIHSHIGFFEKKEIKNETMLKKKSICFLAFGVIIIIININSKLNEFPLQPYRKPGLCY